MGQVVPEIAELFYLGKEGVKLGAITGVLAVYVRPFIPALLKSPLNRANREWVFPQRIA